MSDYPNLLAEEKVSSTGFVSILPLFAFLAKPGKHSF